MSIDHYDDQAKRALIPRDPERYRAALDIARQLNAKSSTGRALKIFTALSKPELLPVATTLGTLGVVAAVGMGIARRLSRRRSAQKRAAAQASSRQLMLIGETAIQIGPDRLAVLSRTRIVERDE
jgi:hypothetical protein